LRYAGAVQPKFLTMDPIKKRKIRLEELKGASNHSEISTDIVAYLLTKGT